MTFETDYKKIDWNAWEQFVENHPLSNVFHTPYFFKAALQSITVKPLPIFGFNQKKEIVAYGCSFALSEKKGLIGKLSTRGQLYNLPIAVQNIHPTDILAKLVDKYKNNCIAFNLINFVDNKSQNEALFETGFEHIPHLNFLFDLKKGEEALWNNMSRSRKKQVKRGYNRGLRVETTLECNNFSEVYSIWAETYQRANLPLLPEEFFQNIVNELQPQKKVLFVNAFLDDKMVGNRMILLHNGLLYDYYAGALAEALHAYPNDVLVWETIKWGANNGYHTFNFGGAGHPDKPYGVREFKKKFGGELVNFGMYKRINQSLNYKLFELGVQVKKMLKPTV